MSRCGLDAPVSMSSLIVVGVVSVVANPLISGVVERRCSHSLALVYSFKLNAKTCSSPAGSRIFL